MGIDVLVAYLFLYACDILYVFVAQRAGKCKCKRILSCVR